MKATEEKHKLDLENLRGEMAKQLWEMEGKKKKGMLTRLRNDLEWKEGKSK